MRLEPVYFILFALLGLVAAHESEAYVALNNACNLKENSAIPGLLASIQSPVVVFNFVHYHLFKEMERKSNRKAGSDTYLVEFFKHNVTNVLSDRHDTKALSDMLRRLANIFNFGDLPADIDSEVLSQMTEDDLDSGMIWMQFFEHKYHLDDLNNLIAAVIEQVYRDQNKEPTVIIQVPKSHEDHKRKKSRIFGANAKQDEEENTEILSTIWTEGLISCILVSLLLLGILVVALSWISNIEVSYGALSRKTAPLKKTQ